MTSNALMHPPRRHKSLPGQVVHGRALFAPCQPDSQAFRDMMSRESPGAISEYTDNFGRLQYSYRRRTGKELLQVMGFPHLAFTSQWSAATKSFFVEYFVRHRVGGEFVVAIHVPQGTFEMPASYSNARVPYSRFARVRRDRLHMVIVQLCHKHLALRLQGRLSPDGKRLGEQVAGS